MARGRVATRCIAVTAAMLAPRRLSSAVAVNTRGEHVAR
jgi:hypothetical protein